VSTEPPPDVLRAAALGCLVASFMATELGYAQLAIGLLSIAGILREYADLLERRAARPRVFRLALTGSIGASGRLAGTLTSVGSPGR
jgi:hypothetical protein